MIELPLHSDLNPVVSPTSGCGYKQAGNGSDRATAGQICGTCQCMARQESGLDASCLEGGRLEVGRAWS